MRTEIGVHLAKTHLAELLERVAQGEQFTITKHGRPVARLVPVSPDAGLEQRRAPIARLKELRKGVTLGAPLKESINQGRR